MRCSDFALIFLFLIPEGIENFHGTYKLLQTVCERFRLYCSPLDALTKKGVEFE